MIFKEPGHLKSSAKEKEQKEMITLDPENLPAVESFLDPNQVTKVWPEKVTTDKSFLAQIEVRKKLIESFDEVFDRLPHPNITIESAIDQGYITEEQTVRLYESLSHLFETEPDYKRLALYLPFELLPDKKWKTENNELQAARGKFAEDYMKVWNDLLSVHDVRANFVDGDVLEVNQRTRDLPRVVKVAHMIPKIVGKGMLEAGQVITLMEETDDQILKNSIADAISVMVDLGQLSKNELTAMKNSKDRLTSNMGRIIDSQLKTSEKQPEKTGQETNTEYINKKLEDGFLRIENEDYGDITKNRRAWLIQTKKQDLIEKLAGELADSFFENRMRPDNLNSFLAPNAKSESQQVLVNGIRKLIESAITSDKDKARRLYKEYEPIIISLWKTKDPKLNETVAKTFRRLNQAGIVSQDQMDQLQIETPHLSGSFLENVKMMEKEIREIREKITFIESDEEFSKMIYPVALIGGSLVKGYGTPDSDIDVIVFVRPETSRNDQDKLREKLEKMFIGSRIKGPVIEFWLEEKADNLYVRDFPEPDIAHGESYMTSTLFGAAWMGNKKVIDGLRPKILAPYLRETSKTIFERPARSVYLEEIERDALQYRLMHGGYERFFPAYGGIHTKHADDIDGKSMFWDSGYRQVATKLYIKRVFLPKVPEK